MSKIGICICKPIKHISQITVTNKWVSNQVDFSWYVIFCFGHSKETINSCQSLIIQPFDFVVANIEVLKNILGIMQGKIYKNQRK